jgi:hypothetical protein
VASFRFSRNHQSKIAPDDSAHHRAIFSIAAMLKDGPSFIVAVQKVVGQIFQEDVEECPAVRTFFLDSEE